MPDKSQDKDSVFAQHWRVINDPPSKWSDEDKKLNEQIQSLRLPPLPERSNWFGDFLGQYRSQLQMGFASALALSLAIVVLLPKEEKFASKGSLQVSVFWSRDGKPSEPFNSETKLQNGDKVSASVQSSDPAIVYWAVTDHNMKLISEPGDIEDSKMELKPGESQKFNSSFSLVGENEGENLIVIVCPKSTDKTNPSTESKPPMDSILNREFVTQLLAEQQKRANNCVFVGYKLRSLP